MTFPDVYFTPEYGRLYEKHDGGRLEVFSYKNGSGEISCQFIRRRLDTYEGYEGFSDITTPYGYGGPVILECREGERERLVAGFRNSFEEYCRDNRIVSFFIRFHPLLKNAADFIGAFDRVSAVRKVVAIDLTKNILMEETDKTTRRTYRSGIKGISIEHDWEFRTLDSFIALYYSLMDRRRASDYYYFPPDYFTGMKNSLHGHAELVNAVYDGEIISSDLLMHYGDYVHSHLGAASALGYQMKCGAVVMVDNTLKYAGEGRRWFLLGGGATGDPEDSLLRFKKHFTRTEPFDFYTGESVYDRKIYEGLCALAKKKGGDCGDAGFFPPYRA